MLDDAFEATSNSKYDPQKTWFLAHDVNPPYDRSVLRITLPSSFVQQLQRWILNEPSKTFTSPQQFIRNLIYHGFHHAEEIQSFPANELSKSYQDFLDSEELHEVVSVKGNTVKRLHQALEASLTAIDREKVMDRALKLAGETNDPEYAKLLQGVAQRSSSQPWHQG